MKRQTRLYFTRERMRQVRNSTFAQAAEPSTKGPVQAERTAGTADSDGISMDTKDKSSHKSGIRITEKESPSLKSKLREEKFSSANEAAKLRFKKAETSAVKTETPPARRRVAGKMAEQAVSSALHEKVSEYEEDNVGVEAANRSGQAVEAASETVENVRYGRKLRAYRSAEKLEKQAAGQELHAMYEKKMAMNPEAASNPISRWRQKQAIRKEYQAARAGRTAGQAASGTASAGSAVTSFSSSVRNFFGGGDTSGLFHMFTRKAGGKSPLIIIGICAVLFMLVSGMMSSCSLLVQGGSEALLSATFTAADDDIRGAEEDYRAMEAELRRQIAEIKEENPGYDEYRLHITEIGHNPYELAAFLTVLYEDYTRAEVQETLRALFEAQYSLSTSHSIETVTETRTVRVGESLGQVVTSGYCNCSLCCGGDAGGPTASGVMPTAGHTIAVDMYDPLLPFGTKVVMNGTEYVVEDNGPLTRYGVTFDVYYDDHDVAEAHGHQTWEAFLSDDNGEQEVQVTQTTRKKIFSVDLDSTSLQAVIDSYGLNTVQKARYQVLLSTKGNKDYLFADDIYANASQGNYPDYRVPSAALSDIQFANMLHEAEKYIGYPYVWGGDSPETSFDCSGFISWVINHSGNGWDVGRMTANELCEYCVTVSPSEAKPGDLVFFQGTYDTDGASHVGLYVGDGMMLHCGNPIHYSSLSDEYWQVHFRSFGRIP